MMSISVVIHTLNSGKYLRQCLESVRDFDEIVVCDMFSVDDTLDIAREYGARIVMTEPCNGIPEPARAFAVNQASREWVLVLDSDEVVPEALKNYLYNETGNGRAEGFFLSRKNYFMGRFMRGSFPDYQLRFFRKDSFMDWPVTIHSRPVISGRLAKAPRTLATAMIHLEEAGVEARILKINKYTERELERHKAKNPTIMKMIFKPVFLFTKMYFIKGGILDGRAGFIYAALQSFYKFTVMAKMAEREKGGESTL
jgi:glycosyltransferase involved in cell wall biosynthesis